MYFCDENNADVMQTICVSSQIHKTMSNFYSRIPAIGATLGTVFALTVATPLLVSLIAKFTLGGNKAAVPYADTYIRNSDTIVVTIPELAVIMPVNKTFTSRAWFAGVAHSQKSTYKQICFYSPEYKRHLAVISFIGGYNVAKMGTGKDAYNVDVENDRLSIIYNAKSISAYINKTQWQDPTYGTKDNPMPIFFKRALSGFECAGGMEDFIYIKPSVYKKFVELYLAHGLEPEEFDRLYGADMKRLGLTD